jgi:hypothetical protein
LFLIHCFKYCNVPIPEGQFTFYCNNKGLLKKLQYMQSYNNAINATVLHLEWDIVSAVYHLQLSFHPLPDLQHVKGHQDDGTSVKFLDVPSQMNVVANKLATYDLQEYGSMKPIVPFDPMSGIQLSINGQHDVSMPRSINKNTMCHSSNRFPTNNGLLRFNGGDGWEKIDGKEREFVSEYNAAAGDHTSTVGDFTDKTTIPNGIPAEATSDIHSRSTRGASISFCYTFSNGRRPPSSVLDATQSVSTQRKNCT